MIFPFDATRAKVREQLKSAGVPHERAESDVLLAGVLGISRGDVQLRALLGSEISDEDAAAVEVAAARRARREPLQHVLGVAPFLDIELAVGPGVFVPRPETESLVTEAVQLLPPAPALGRRLSGIDVGAGSGAVAIGVARTHGGIDLIAVERSSEAWPWLRRNCAALAAAQVSPFFGDAGRAFERLEPASLDLVVSNPPYVPAKARPESREVWRHDPAGALYSGDDGLDFIRQLAGWAARGLRSGGALAIEHEDTQGAEIRRVLTRVGFLEARTRQDLTGRDRITTARRGPLPAA